MLVWDRSVSDYRAVLRAGPSIGRIGLTTFRAPLSMMHDGTSLPWTLFEVSHFHSRLGLPVIMNLALEFFFAVVRCEGNYTTKIQAADLSSTVVRDVIIMRT